MVATILVSERHLTFVDGSFHILMVNSGVDLKERKNLERILSGIARVERYATSWRCALVRT